MKILYTIVTLSDLDFGAYPRCSSNMDYWVSLICLSIYHGINRCVKFAFSLAHSFMFPTSLHFHISYNLSPFRFLKFARILAQAYKTFCEWEFHTKSIIGAHLFSMIFYVGKKIVEAIG